MTRAARRARVAHALVAAAARRAGRAASRPRPCAGARRLQLAAPRARRRRSRARARRRRARAPRRRARLAHARVRQIVCGAPPSGSRAPMCGESARTRSCSSRAGRAGSSSAVGGGDLARRRSARRPAARSRAARARRPPARARAARSAELERALVDRAGVVVGPDREALQRRHRPRVELLDEQHRRDGALAPRPPSARARSGAAPRQRGSARGMQVDERQRVEQRARHEQAVGDHGHDLEPARLQQRQRVRPRARAVRARARARARRRRPAAAPACGPGRRAGRAG